MMKKIYFIETDDYNMLVSVDEDNTCRYLTETEDFPCIVNDDPEEQKQKALDFLDSVEDNSSWEDDCDYEQIFEEFPIKIVAEIEKEL